MATNTSAQALLDHWPRAASEGRINPATAAALATACRRVLEVQGDWPNLDVSSLDVEDSIRVFRNRRSGALKASSLRDYEKKFRRAVSAYIQYLKDPVSWKYPSRTPTWGQPSAPNAVANSDVGNGGGGGTEAATDAPQEYRYPFRPGFLAKLVIPSDATATEIGRLAAWAKTLAVDYQPEQ